jgi:hypothetical protein
MSMIQLKVEFMRKSNWHTLNMLLFTNLAPNPSNVNVSANASFTAAIDNIGYLDIM